MSLGETARYNIMHSSSGVHLLPLVDDEDGGRFGTLHCTPDEERRTVRVSFRVTKKEVSPEDELIIEAVKKQVAKLYPDFKILR